MSRESPKQALLSQLAGVAKALGQAHRLELLELVAQGERSVDALADLAGLTVGNASQHLQHLRRAGLLTSRRDGRQVLYRLKDEAIVSLLVDLRRIAERNLAEVQRLLSGYFHDWDSLEPVSREDLIGRMRAGTVMVLDVRPLTEYNAAHLPGARNIPLPELEKKLNELPRDQAIVAYCRGPYCILSFEAVAILRDHGYDAHRLVDGLPEWRAAGLPLEPGGIPG
jgi:rhodanese-related sulfurtransferase/DNA-binding MarR family transcriptional regulator